MRCNTMFGNSSTSRSPKTYSTRRIHPTMIIFGPNISEQILEASWQKTRLAIASQLPPGITQNIQCDAFIAIVQKRLQRTRRRLYFVVFKVIKLTFSRKWIHSVYSCCTNLYKQIHLQMIRFIHYFSISSLSWNSLSKLYNYNSLWDKSTVHVL